MLILPRDKSMEWLDLATVLSLTQILSNQIQLAKWFLARRIQTTARNNPNVCSIQFNTEAKDIRIVQ